MKTVPKLLVAALTLSLLSGCAATIPVKVAAKTAKLGVKTTAKVAEAVVPNGSEETEEK